LPQEGLILLEFATKASAAKKKNKKEQKTTPNNFFYVSSFECNRKNFQNPYGFPKSSFHYSTTINYFLLYFLNVNFRTSFFKYIYLFNEILL